jgi:hypothetical protein
MRRFQFGPSLPFLAVAVSLLPAGEWARAAEPVRANAVVSANFDDANSPGAVSITGVGQPLAATLANGPTRVPSPFWNQLNKTALRLDATKKQTVQLVDLPYLDRPDALTLSLFFLSLHDRTDAAPHGIVAKRSDGPRGTNYGVNYVPSTDLFQVYVNDGRGYKIATYSAEQVIGVRRLAHLTATMEVADAPAPDADSDRDDVLVRLYVNGEPVAPKSVAGGEASGSDAWLTNVNVAGLLNDAPLTLGGSTAQTEYTSGVIDEFLLFPRALSAGEVQRLFLEAAGASGPQLARRDAAISGPTPLPFITSISQFGLQMGKTTRLVVSGRNLSNHPRIDLPIAGLTQTVVKESSPRRFIVDLSLPANLPPGIYPLSVVTTAGISKSVGVAIDGLTEQLVGDTTRERPATLPGAFSGLISGATQSRIYFQGKAGARLVAEVEAKRIGSPIEPVLEIKNSAGTSLAIEWGKAYLRGDARAEVTLPADGSYFVELHDLEYKAPQDSPFRLLVGDFRAVDQYFPPVAERGTAVEVQPIGTGIPLGTLIAANLQGDPAGLAKLLVLPSQLHASGPLPPLRISDGVELLEVAQPGTQLQMIDARFADKRSSSIAISGRLAKPEEVDHYLLAVTPGQSLLLSVDGRSLNSPVDGHLTILSYPEKKTLAADGGTPGVAASGFQYQVPAGVSDIQVAVRDLLGRGGKHFVYRLRIAPTGQPDFSLALLSSPLNVPANGRALIPLQVDRKGYAGPIKLSVEGDAHLSIAPTELAAEGGSRKVLVTISARNEKPIVGVDRLRIVGETIGTQPALRRIAVVADPKQPELAGFRDLLPAASHGAARLRIDTLAPPTVVVKGRDAECPVSIAGQSMGDGQWLRLALVSTEQPRPADPKKKRGGNKPIVAAAADQALPAVAGKGMLKMVVPQDVADAAIDFVIKAEIVPHPYSNNVIATIYSNPFRVLVQDPPKAAPLKK